MLAKQMQSMNHFPKKRDLLSTVEFMLYTEENGNAQGTDPAEQTKPPM